jgi:hypothetical protein
LDSSLISVISNSSVVSSNNHIQEITEDDVSEVFNVRLFYITFGYLRLKAELQACLLTAFLSIAASSASLFMISVRVVPAQRDTEMLKVRLFTSGLMHLGIV